MSSFTIYSIICSWSKNLYLIMKSCLHGLGNLNPGILIPEDVMRNSLNSCAWDSCFLYLNFECEHYLRFVVSLWVHVLFSFKGIGLHFPNNNLSLQVIKGLMKRCRRLGGGDGFVNVKVLLKVRISLIHRYRQRLITIVGDIKRINSFCEGILEFVVAMVVLLL
ncbi:hypothetical protein VNO77_34231 [Canavalia gladiata]|uniref:Uncharacterized protein n=1 Tax=Canavalia gladiata TaxID=3824 RepID=A0AAN9PZL7_CANGL